jgi:histidinol-phosphatase (PHP family)
MSDYHLHLYPHAPRTGGPAPDEDPVDFIERYVVAAAARGIEELGFTEHLFRCVESSDVLGPFWEQASDRHIREQTKHAIHADRTLSLDDYVATIVRAKKRGLPVLLGLEVDFAPDSYADVLKLLDNYEFDFLIGSVHWIDGWMFDRSAAIPEIHARGARSLFEEYFAVKTQLAEAGGVDVLAHADRCKNMGILPDEEPFDLYETLATVTAASDLAVEVSSGGLRQPVAEINPAPPLLRLFRDAGVPITLASDAHYPHDAGFGHSEVVAAARAAGYTDHLRYEKRRRFTQPLPPIR